MYVLSVEVEVDPRHADDYRSVIERQARTSVEREAGCFQFDVAVDPENPNRFFLYEIYRDKSAFDAHLAAPHSKENGAATKPWIRNQTVRFWSRICGLAQG